MAKAKKTKDKSQSFELTGKHFLIGLGIIVLLLAYTLGKQGLFLNSNTVPTPTISIPSPTDTPIPTATPTPQPTSIPTSSDWQYKVAVSIAIQNCLTRSGQAVNTAIAEMNANGTPFSPDQIKSMYQLAIDNCYQAVGLPTPTPY